MVQLPTSRVTGVYWEADYPGEPDEQTKRELTELFDYVAASYPEPEGRYISGGHAGIAQLAQSPRIALGVLKMTHAVLGEGTWSATHLALRELIVQTVNCHFKAEYCFQAHIAVAQRAGLTVEQQAMIPCWRTASHIFSDEQKLVIEYAYAVCAGDVPDDLFARMVARYGEKGAMEATAIVGAWSLWAMILNATRTKFDFNYGTAAT
jgi:4-carboxymuconolactone decarboxylase